MNNNLTEEIAYHILASLSVLPSDFINHDQSKSVLDKQFLLPEKLTFESPDGQPINKNIYGCQISVTDTKEFKMLLADCSQEKNVPEFALVIQLKDAPAFGIYLVYNRLVDDPPEHEALIAVNTDKKNWVPCTVYLQATFLAGMEQLKDLGFGWSRCKDYKDMHSYLLSFVKFHTNFFGVMDEGKED